MNAAIPIAFAVTGMCKSFEVDSGVAAYTILAPTDPTGTGKATNVRIGRVIHDLREVL